MESEDETVLEEVLLAVLEVIEEELEAPGIESAPGVYFSRS